MLVEILLATFGPRLPITGVLNVAEIWIVLFRSSTGMLCASNGEVTNIQKIMIGKETFTAFLPVRDRYRIRSDRCSGRGLAGIVQRLGKASSLPRWVNNGPDGTETLLPVYLNQRIS